MTNLVERLKKTFNHIIELWKKLTTKQKSLIISVVVCVVCTIGILAFVLTRTQYKKLITCEDTKQANQVVELLEENAIAYKLGNDSTVISVDANAYDSAQLLLGANDLTADSGMTMEELFNNSMSTTEDERKLKSNIYWQDKLANTCKTFDGVKDAVVYITNTDSGDSILSEEKEQSASIVLTTTSKFKTSSAATIAEMVAAAIDTAKEKIRVTSSDGTILFDGNSDLYSSGSLSSKEEYKEKLTNTRANDVRILLIKQGYDDAQVMPNFSFDMDEVEELYKEYTPAEGSDQGVYKSSYEYKAENTNDASGVPGTDSNDEDTTTYNIQDNTGDGSSVEYTDIDYLPNERVTNTTKEIGAINAEESSISIVLTKYKVYSEEILEDKGELKKMSFEEYIQENNLEKVTTLTVADELYDSVASATGISNNKITITAYEQPIFKFKETNKEKISDLIMIVLLVLVVGLLVFVFIKGFKPGSVDASEAELSIEELLATSDARDDLEDIEHNDKSDSHLKIEEFIDSNPEAAAQLLRNWLGEDWRF